MTLRRFSELKRSMAALAICAVASCGIISMDGVDPASLSTHGLTDWISHLLTAVIVASGLRSLRLPIPIWSVLIGSVVLDTGLADLAENIERSSRNGSHSLIVVIAIALVGFIDRRHANIWLGVALGALSHLWRDMGTGTVPVLWPAVDNVWGTWFRRSLAGILGGGIALIGNGMLLSGHAKANHRHEPERNQSSAAFWCRVDWNTRNKVSHQGT